MAVPAVISAATLAYAMYFPDATLDVDSRSRSSGAISPSGGGGTGIFVYGMLFGMGVSSALGYECRRRRVLERLRVAFFSWLYDDDDEEGEEKLAAKFRRPLKIDNVEGSPILAVGSQEGESPCGVRCELLSPDWAASNLSVSVLTLVSGAELLAKNSEGVEFYYVINGEGIYSKGEEKINMAAGMGLVVDPGCMRGFAARGRGDFVLLRATDTPLADRSDTMARLEASSMSSTAAILTAGLGKVESLVKAYARKEEINAPEVVVNRDEWTAVEKNDLKK